MRFLALRSSSVRSPLTVIRFCSSKNDDNKKEGNEGETARTGPATIQRVIETRGALKNFMAQTAAQTEGPGLWAKLKRDANPAAEGKTWNADQSTLGTGKGVGSPGLFKKPSSGGSGPQNRSFNPRAAGRKTSGSGDSDGAGSPGNVYLGGASGKKRRGEADDGIDEQAVIEESRRNDDDGEDEEIPPEILSVLEEDKFIKEILDGKSIDTRGMDAIDSFLADAYFESHKTTDGVVREILKNKKWSRTRLPKPRGIKELVGVMTPNITSAPKGSEGYQLGQTAWGVLSKNHWFNEREKSEMANDVARRFIEWEEGILQEEYDEDGLVMEIDEIFRKDFKKGHQGELQEIERQRRSLTKNSKAYAFAGDHTNWDVDAVADEDDLDNNSNGSSEDDKEEDEEEEDDNDDAEWRRIDELQKNKKK